MVPACVGPSSSSSIAAGATAASGTAAWPYGCAHHRRYTKTAAHSHVSRQLLEHAVCTTPQPAFPRIASLAVSSSSRTKTRHNPARTVTVTAAAVAAGPQSGSGAALAAAAATTEALLQWMQQQGCVVQGVQLAYSRGNAGQIYRELKASQDLNPGDVLIAVPLSCTIHYKEADITTVNSSSSSSGNSSGSRHAALRRLQANVPTASDGSHGAWQFKMALEVLLHATDPASPLQPYIQTLPGACPGIPTPQAAMLWPAQQLKELQSAQLEADAGSQSHWLEQYCTETLAKLPGTDDDAFGGQLVTQERLGWALAVSMSRAFGFKKLGGYALCPLVDMANHAAVSNAEVRYTEDTGRVKLIANSKVAAGQPILLNYGSHDNANLLLSYGFVMDGNTADRFRVNLDMDTMLAAILQFVGGELPPTGRATDSLKQWQRTTLQQLGLLPCAAMPAAAAAAAAAAGSAAGEDAAGADAVAEPLQQQQQQLLSVSIGGQPPVSGPLLAAVRVVLSQERAVVKSRTLEQLGDWDQPLSTSHEAIVVKALVGLCTVLYKSFPTSIQQDKATLAALQQQQQQQQQDDVLAHERQLTAVQFRLGQKLLLEASTKQIIQRLQELAAKA